MHYKSTLFCHGAYFNAETDGDPLTRLDEGDTLGIVAVPVGWSDPLTTFIWSRDFWKGAYFIVPTLRTLQQKNVVHNKAKVAQDSWNITHIPWWGLDATTSGRLAPWLTRTNTTAAGNRSYRSHIHILRNGRFKGWKLTARHGCFHHVHILLERSEFHATSTVQQVFVKVNHTENE